MCLNAGDSNLICNVKSENICVEDFRLGELLNIHTFYNKKYCTSPGRGIENPQYLIRIKYQTQIENRIQNKLNI